MQSAGITFTQRQIASKHQELARDVIRIYLWSTKQLLLMIFTHQERIAEEARLKMPIKPMWMVPKTQ